MKVLIVEDQEYQAKMLAGLLHKYDEDIDIVEMLTGVRQTVDWLSQKPELDLIFMDVELEDGFCFDIFNEISVQCPIIFTTNHINYSLEAFYTTGIHYLVKPITKSRLDEGLDKYFTLQSKLGLGNEIRQEENPVYKEGVAQKNSKLLLKVGKKQLPVVQENIALISIVDGYVYLRTKDDKKYLVDQNLDDLERKLDAKIFFRLNRQVITNIDVIGSFYTFTRGRLKVDLRPYIEEAIIVSFKVRGDFLKWINDNIS